MDDTESTTKHWTASEVEMIVREEADSLEPKDELAVARRRIQYWLNAFNDMAQLFYANSEQLDEETTAEFHRAISRTVTEFP